MAGVEAGSRHLGELVGAARDLALELDSPLTAGSVSLFAKDGRVVLGMTSDKLFSTTGDALLADAAPMLTAVGKVSQAHPTLRVLVREPSGTPVAQARLQLLAQALRERGVPEAKLVIESCPAASSEAAPVAMAAKPTPGGDADDDIPVADTPAAAVPAPAKPAATTPLPLYEIAFAP
jgi:hypothetical protein